LNNLCKNANKGLILSWAVPGQPGHGHVNCRPNEYIESQIHSRGFERDFDGEKELRSSATLDWFKKTIMVFRKITQPKPKQIDFSLLPTNNNWRQNHHWCRIIMNSQTEELMRSYLQKRAEANLSCLEISGMEWKNSGYFQNYTNKSYPSFDICQQTNTQEKYDIIVAEQVWEHLKFPHRATRNVFNMLNSKGAFLLSTPFLIQIHDVPGDYTRWTPEGLKYLLVDCGFNENLITVGAWGNRECIKDSFYTPWSIYQPKHSLENEPEFPIVVWALAIKE
jgi:hypothetical protein